MKRMLIIAVLAMTVSSLALGQTTGKKADSTKTQSSNVEQELMKLEREWADAAVKRDTAVLERIEADDIISTDPEGMVWNKAQDIANLKAGDFKAESIQLDDMKVRVYGNAAVVTGRATVKGQFKGKDISGQYRSTDTFVKRNGRWQCVATQGTRIAEQ